MEALLKNTISAEWQPSLKESNKKYEKVDKYKEIFRCLVQGNGKTNIRLLFSKRIKTKT